jgi:hypothetical protein
MDGKFDSHRGALSALHISLNTSGAGKHVPDVERHITTVKERTRSIYNVLPLQRMPARLVIEMVYASVFWLNSFPVRDGVSTSVSPREIVTGMPLD